MNPVTEDIKDILEADSSLALTYATDLFISKEPNRPDDCVTLYDTPSYPPLLTLDGETYYRSGLQIRVRNQDYDTGMTLARNIMSCLHGRANETWNGTSYALIHAVGEPAALAWDDKNRVIIIINFNCQRC